MQSLTGSFRVARLLRVTLMRPARGLRALVAFEVAGAVGVVFPLVGSRGLVVVHGELGDLRAAVIDFDRPRS